MIWPGTADDSRGKPVANQVKQTFDLVGYSRCREFPTPPVIASAIGIARNRAGIHAHNAD